MAGKGLFHGSGVTASEKYLTALCRRTFLSLWSHPHVYTKKGRELCDLLVVFENKILIFSDKNVQFGSSSKDISISWNRWFRKAVLESASQLWGAERWIKERRGKIFMDDKEREPFPFDLPDPEKSEYHLIAVTHGISHHCHAHFGGSGSLITTNDTLNLKKLDLFSVPDLDKKKSYIHVLDDVSLEVLMEKLDTVSDFTQYLKQKEFLYRRSTKKVFSTGEEELLAAYLSAPILDGSHKFSIPDDIDAVTFAEGLWEEYEQSEQRKSQKKEDEISYVWDMLIEKFNFHAREGTQYKVSEGGIKDSEKVVRFMAREPRIKRRYLGKAIIGLLEKTEPTMRSIRVLPPLLPGDPYYLLLLFPRDPKSSEYINREAREGFLVGSCRVLKLVFPEAIDVVGIATESGISEMGRSEDAIYLNFSKWTPEDAKDAKDFQEQFGVLLNLVEKPIKVKEYPPFPKNQRQGRNEKCCCGSGKKYKKCCIGKRPTP